MVNPLNTPLTPSALKRINNRLRNSPAWSNLYRSIDTVIRSTVTAPREQLQTVRDSVLHHRGDWMNLPDGRRGIVNAVRVANDGSASVYAQIVNRDETVEIQIDSNLKDRQVLINNCVRKGFNYLSDTLTTDDYARINDWIEYFWPQSGTDNYYRFMAFIKDMSLESDVLWTSDDGDLNSDPLAPGVLVPQPDGGVTNSIETADSYPFLEPNWGHYTGVWDGGHDYPTSHVQLRYDPLVYPDTNEDDLFNLFYLLAPIQLVLERIVWDIETQAEQLVTAVTGSIDFFDSGQARFEPCGEQQSKIFAYNGGITLYDSGRLNVVYAGVQDIYVARTAGFSFSGFFQDTSGNQIDARSFDWELKIYDSTGLVLLTATIANGRLYTTPDGVLACMIPPTIYNPVLNSYSYRLRRRSTLPGATYSTLFSGNIVVLDSAFSGSSQDIYVRRSHGFSFSGSFTDFNNSGIDESDYVFKIDIFDGLDLIIEASNANHRLYFWNSNLVCYIPPKIAYPFKDTYTYQLSRKEKFATDDDYAVYLRGNIIVEND